MPLVMDAEIASGLEYLRNKVIKKANIPSSKLDESIKIATWNIRAFGKSKRKPAALFYIAEILRQFDLVAVQELGPDLADFRAVMEIMGPFWKLIYSDYSKDSAGNSERIGFLFDKRAVALNGLIAEANPPRLKKGDTYLPELDFWRAPYMAGFCAGRFDFVLVAAHARFNNDKDGREKELALMADWVADKRKDKGWREKDIIVVGDFNVDKVGDKFFKALTGKGLCVPKELNPPPATNLLGTRNFDQFLYFPDDTKLFDIANRDPAIKMGGTIEIKPKDADSLFPGQDLDAGKFSFQISDHRPLWMYLNVDTDLEDLDGILRQEIN
jgi:hypothetical protein